MSITKEQLEELKNELKERIETKNNLQVRLEVVKDRISILKGIIESHEELK